MTRNDRSDFTTEPNPNALLDVPEAARFLGTSERHVRRLVADRRIEHIKLGDGRSARLRFRVGRLNNWLDDHTVNAEPGA